MLDLILVSSSPYRRELLTRLYLLFESASPDVDESHHPGESAEELVRRPSTSRTETLTGCYPQRLVIGSDQVTILDGDIFGKSYTPECAIQQLRGASGKNVTFLTGLALLNSASRRVQVACVPSAMHFCHLDESRIHRYVEAEHPLDCIGSFKTEGLGVSLFRATEGEDATNLVDLPLVRLVDMLLEEDAEIF